MQLEDRLKRLHALKAEKQVAEAQAKKIQERIDEADEQIREEFENRQIKSMKLKGIGNFYIHTQSYPKVTDHAALHEWMKTNGFDWNIVLAFNAQKFKGFYRELLDNKQSLPVGCENFVKASIRIGKE